MFCAWPWNFADILNEFCSLPFCVVYFETLPWDRKGGRGVGPTDTHLISFYIHIFLLFFLSIYGKYIELQLRLSFIFFHEGHMRREHFSAIFKEDNPFCSKFSIVILKNLVARSVSSIGIGQRYGEPFWGCVPKNC